MPLIGLTVNGKRHQLDLPPDIPLLWVLRDHLALTGTKYGCGEGVCGSCTVLVGGRPVRSCLLPVSRLGAAPVVTIEGLGPEGRHALQRAWLEEDVAQCGYCQPAMILTAAALLETSPHPDDDAIDRALGDVVCRCGTYPRIRRALRRAAAELGAEIVAPTVSEG
jgi:isoquinoline 1-oxidoreductase alpha subunit